MTTDFGAVPFEDDPNGMRAVLAGLPDPGPMPDDVADRILASLRIEYRALATERASRAAAFPTSDPTLTDIADHPRHSRQLVSRSSAAPADPVPVVAAIESSEVAARSGAPDVESPGSVAAPPAIDEGASHTLAPELLAGPPSDHEDSPTEGEPTESGPAVERAPEGATPLDAPSAAEASAPDPASSGDEPIPATRRHTADGAVIPLPSRSHRRPAAPAPVSRHARRPSRAPKWILGLAAASLVVVGGGKLLLHQQSSGGAASSTAAGSGALSSTYEAASAPSTDRQSTTVNGADAGGTFSTYLVTGRAFTDDGLRGQAMTLVTGRLDATATRSATAPSGPRFFASTDQATTCIQLVGAPTDAITRVEIGTYAGTPAALIAYAEPASPRFWTAIVVGRSCGLATNDTLAGPVTVTAPAK